VIANATAQVNRDGNAVRRLLLDQVTAPVRWTESMRVMIDAGITQAIELGPGRVLAGLMRRIDREVKVHPAEDSATVKATIAALAASAKG
jgi:[acyl-carrier-protein] S-malonyltransferase